MYALPPGVHDNFLCINYTLLYRGHVPFLKNIKNHGQQQKNKTSCNSTCKIHRHVYGFSDLQNVYTLPVPCVQHVIHTQDVYICLTVTVTLIRTRGDVYLSIKSIHLIYYEWEIQHCVRAVRVLPRLLTLATSTLLAYFELR